MVCTKFQADNSETVIGSFWTDRQTDIHTEKIIPLKSSKKRENFSFKILKTTQDFDPPFFDFCHLCYQFLCMGVLDF